MSNQLQITGGAKVRNLEGVITGSTGVLSSVPLGGANGVATLDSGGKVPVSQLPSSVVTYLGTWNAATNTPTLTNGTGDAGDMYLCNVAGTVNFGAGPISFNVGDWVLYGSGTWQKSNGQNGTVTSVAVSESSAALNITGSPITTSGTINIGFAGTSAQYVAGDGSLITFPSLTGYVPYTGATGDVNLGTHALKANKLSIYDTTNSAFASITTDSSLIYFADASGATLADMSSDYFNIYTLANNTATLDASGITSSQEFSFPDKSGTLALLDDIPSLTGYVPYTGATSDLNLGTHKLSLNSEQFASISAPTYSEGALWYDSTQKALAYYNDISNNILHIGQEVQLKVHNNTGSTIAKGAPVYVTSTSSGYSYPNVALAKADTLTTANVIGLANQAIPNGADGYITLSGLLTGANTGSFTVGDVLYLSPYSAGQLMNTLPPTGYAVRVGVVSYSNTPNGTIYINQSNAYSTAANIVGTIQVSQGGTGATTAGGALTNLGAQAQLNGTGFVKASGTTISYDNSTYYLASNPSAYIPLTALSAGTGISYNNTTGVISSTITQYTDAMARASISLTTTGTSGAATYNSTTGVLNIPQYIGIVTSVFGRTGAVVATEGDYTLTQLGDVTITTPSTGQVLRYNGTGWVNSTETYVGTVTSVAMSVPTGLSVSGSPITSSGTLAVTFTTGYSIPTTASQSNWDTAYTNRITSLTTTGSSGSATLVSNVLNIPTYTLAGLGGISLTSLSASTPLSYNNTTGAFSIQVANTSQSGYLSSTDWNTFNNKQNALTNPVTGTGVSGQVTYFNGTSTVTGSANHFWDAANNRLGIGTNSPTNLLTLIAAASNKGIDFVSYASTSTVVGSINFEQTNDILSIMQKTAYSGGALVLGTNSTERMRITSSGILLLGTSSENSYGGATSLQINGASGGLVETRYNNTTGMRMGSASDSSYFWEPRNVYMRFATNDTERMRITNGGNLLVGTTTDNGSKLQVTGAATFSSSVTANSTISTSDGFYSSKTGSNSVASGAYLQLNNNGIIQANASNGLDFWTLNGSWYQRMTITQAGNVLIGTTTDDTIDKLQINGNIKAFNGNLIITSNTQSSKQGITSVPNQDSSSVNLSTIFPAFNFATGNDVSLNLQIIATSGASGNASSHIYNCVRTDTGTWTTLLVSSVGSANILTLTFTGTTSSPILTITGVGFMSVYYSILQR